MEQSFLPLLFGGDINVYSVARAFHEAYGVKSICFGKFPSGPCVGSGMIEYHTSEKTDQAETFLQNVVATAEKHPDDTIIVLGCGDSYVQLCAELQGQFPKNCIAPYISGELLNTLINKEDFYNLCDQYGIDHPATVIHRADMGHDFALPFDPPYICKPADGVCYWQHPFAGNDKVFILKDRKSLDETLDKVYASGYDKSMILQEFVPGDDSYMHVLTSYSGADCKVKMMCLGHVLLEEHTRHGIGNHAVIITEPDEEICAKLRSFLEEIQFTGFSNFDIKYDARDGKFKVFEINCRQGRSNYYVTGSGQNIAQWLVEDRMEHSDQTFTLADKKALWTVVPMGVAYKYTPKKYHAEMKALVAGGAVSNSLFYDGDPGGSSKKLRLIKNQLGHYMKFKKYYAPPKEG
ncbi:MAG: ATP-grasp domain-containing protein [Oscillospiraceae bacterium]